MRAWLVLPWFLVGCGGLESYSVPPAQGRWEFTILQKSTDECDTTDLRADAPLAPVIDSVWITPVDGGFTMAVNGGDDAACEMVGASFECKASVERVRVSNDLQLSTALLATGWLEEGRLMDGDFTFDFGCKGDECADFEASYGVTAPCRTAGTFEAKPENLAF